MSGLLPVLWNYLLSGRRAFPTRERLEQHQTRAITRHLAWISEHSPYYSGFKGESLSAWPVVDKKECLASFDTMNTVGLKLEEARNFALAAENSRNFADTLHGYTIGLSSGTSGTRGVFVASARERALWAGLALRRLLPEGIFSGERIAFFLRANSKLYTSVRTPWVSFRFFDLMAPLTPQLEELTKFQPSVIVAPAQVLRYLAMQEQGGLALSPKKVVSVAEVLEASDREMISASFPVIAEVYQATEGFLGYTCSHGRMHLNEEYLHIEPEWQDVAKTRMVPIITDFSRTSQPVIRYRLNDVLALNKTACPCGNPTQTLSHIEGRCDDQLSLPGAGGSRIPVFGDVMSRILLRSLPFAMDYRLVQKEENTLQLTAALGGLRTEVVSRINALLQNLGVAVPVLRWDVINEQPAFDPSVKCRRIVRVNA